MTNHPVKITVLQTLDIGAIFKEHAAADVDPICFMCKGEKTPFVSKNLDTPPGFCGWAWADIQRDVAHLALGGDFPWIKQKGTMISTCTDGLRPVVFKLERLPIDTPESK